MSGTLYLVPTPIGNLGDLSPRAVQTLERADFIAAEDTRVTLKLLNHLGLKKPLTAYHRHNTQTGGQAVLNRLQSGESCALVTDAGTPAVSDPGEELVAQCAGLGIPVVPIPGPCALVTALAVSGQPTGRFTFEGFLAMNRKNRRAHLDSLRGEERTMIFYEAPHKLCATLRDLAETFGADRVRPGGPGGGGGPGTGGQPGGRSGPGRPPAGGGEVPAGRGEAGRAGARSVQKRSVPPGNGAGSRGTGMIQNCRQEVCRGGNSDGRHRPA